MKIEYLLYIILAILLALLFGLAYIIKQLEINSQNITSIASQLEIDIITIE